MGRRIRESETVDQVEGLLNQALKILDTSGLQLTAAYVDIARCTLMKELVIINPPAKGAQSGTGGASKKRPRQGNHPSV